jgi:hypothetical protein
MEWWWLALGLGILIGAGVLALILLGAGRL